MVCSPHCCARGKSKSEISSKTGTECEQGTRLSLIVKDLFKQMLGGSAFVVKQNSYDHQKGHFAAVV